MQNLLLPFSTGFPLSSLAIATRDVEQEWVVLRLDYRLLDVGFHPFWYLALPCLCLAWMPLTSYTVAVGVDRLGPCSHASAQRAIPSLSFAVHIVVDARIELKTPSVRLHYDASLSNCKHTFAIFQRSGRQDWKAETSYWLCLSSGVCDLSFIAACPNSSSPVAFC